MKRVTPRVALMVLVAAGCTTSVRSSILRTPTRPPLLVREAPPPPMSPVPTWTYWQPVDAPVVAAAVDPPELPVLPLHMTFSPGAEALWSGTSPAFRQAIGSRGFAVARPARPRVRLGDFYGWLRDTGTPWVVTLDALFFLVHVAFERALADVDARVVVPLVQTMLHHLEVRLAGEGRAAHADLAPSYFVARGVVAVALALAEPNHDPGPDLAPLVATEKARAEAHGRAGLSGFGVAIDYTALSPVGAADRDEGRARWFRSVAWLENVSLALEGAGEHDSHAREGVATARVQARSALLLARGVEAGVDADAASAWDRIERAARLMIGDTESATPPDLSAAATHNELDLRSAAWLSNVVAIDRVRHTVERGRAHAPFRLLGPRATPDSEVLQELTFSNVGKRPQSAAPITWARAEQADPPPPVRSDERALPAALDVAAWLGSGEARAALHDSEDDAYDRYDETLDHLMRVRRASIAERHRTPYLSMIDAIETWLAPSAGDGVQPAASTSAWRKRKADVALAAWTELRHDATSLTRIPLGDLRLSRPSAGPQSVPAFVEPHPEAIAKLAGLVRQAGRALESEGQLPPGSPGLRILDEVDDLLWTALGAAEYETADESLPPPLEAALADFPARLSALEDALVEAGAADVPLAAQVHSDPSSSRVLEEVTGRIDEAWIVMREPTTHRLWLALGASIPHYENREPRFGSPE